MKRSHLLFSVGMALLACGGTEPMVATTMTGACTVTVGGTASYTSPCSVNLFSSGSTNRTTFALTDQYAVFVSLDLGTKPLQTTPYEPTAATGTVGYTSAGQAWLAASGTGRDQGTFTLTFRKTGSAFGSAKGLDYFGERGTLDATLPAVPNSSASGTITLHATF